MDLESEELRKNGNKLRLGGQPFHMLAMIAERNGGVVTYDELKSKFWPQINIEDYKHSLGNSMLTIRKTLGDSAHEPRYIKTVPPGYQFLIPVTIIHKGSGQANGTKNHHPDEFLVKMQQIQREFLNTSGCRALALLAYRCETLEKQYSLHSNMPELQVLMLDIRLALRHSAVLEPHWADHRISFEIAAQVFNDPDAISVPLADSSRKTLGSVSESVLLVVEHTAQLENGERIVRIKAARRATSQERRFYEQSCK